jgi:hypothetical protein
MTSRTLPALVGLIGTVLTLAACGPGAQPIVVTGPFTAEHETAFENGVDYIADPTILEGPWLTSWEEDVDRRVQLSDAIAFVTVTTIRQDVDLDRHETLRLVARVDRERHGSVPDELSFVVRQGQPGFGTVTGNDGRILNQRFVAFIKWAEESGQVVARWHLSPASERVVRRVNTIVERVHTAPDERRTIIVRESGSESSGGETEE